MGEPDDRRLRVVHEDERADLCVLPRRRPSALEQVLTLRAELEAEKFWHTVSLTLAAVVLALFATAAVNGAALGIFFAIYTAGSLLHSAKR